MIDFSNLFTTAMDQVWHTFTGNWITLLISAVIAALIKRYADPGRVAAFLRRYTRYGVAAATLAAVGTPLCSCGTTAVMLGMLAGMMPWAPVVAFMVASPLTSPQELIYSAGLFGWPFALAFFTASILLGLAGGLLAAFLEGRGWLRDQARLPLAEVLPAGLPSDSAEHEKTGIDCCSPVSLLAFEGGAAAACCPATVCDCSGAPSETVVYPAPPLMETLGDFCRTGVRLLMMFFVFAFVGYFLNGLIPSAWMAAVFGSGNAYSVPLAAFLGLPLYVNTEASLPLVRTMLDAGMSQGAALAFLITGAGTSFGALAGMLTIARWRVLTVVIGTLWLGAMACGTIWNLLASLFV